ncbi:hypothetical protein NFJ02_24g55230 [Pycnococcus provasolii]
MRTHEPELQGTQRAVRQVQHAGFRDSGVPLQPVWWPGTGHVRRSA